MRGGTNRSVEMKKTIVAVVLVLILGIFSFVDYRKHSERMGIAEMDIERASELFQQGNFQQAEKFLEEAQDYVATPGGMASTSRLWMGRRQDAVLSQIEELKKKLEVKSTPDFSK